MEQYKYSADPIANEAAIVQGSRYRFTILFDGLVRYEWAEDGQFEDRPSIFAINRNFTRPDFKVIENDEVLEIVTSRFHLIYAKILDGFSPNSLSVQVKGAFAQWGTIWKYNVEDMFRANLGGTARTLDGADGAIPLEDGVLSRRGYAHIDDSTSMLLEDNGWVGNRKSGNGRKDGYVFAYGLDFRPAIKAFYAISGPQPALPRWALGNWWSRFYRYTADSYTELMEDFKREGVPLSTAVIDMDFHLTSASPEVLASGSTGWTGYTFDRELFPDPPAFLKALHEKYKLKVTLNDHPADGIHNFEDSYKDMAKALSLDTSHETPIAFDPSSPNFFKQYLQLLHRRLESDGVDFWWIDWQQGSQSKAGFDPLWLLNHYHYIDNKLFPPPFCPTAASRPMIFSRYAGPGSHRYPVGFSGDSVATWDSLDFQPYFTLTASNIGFGNWSHDIGGHMLGARDDELAARWIQLATMSPVLRLHSSDSAWSGKEPWGYGPQARDVMTTWLRFRHRIVPYIATINFAMEEKGERHSMPLVQPMYWDYSAINAAYDVKNQYFFGSSNLIVAPITSPANAKTCLAKVKAWLPPGSQEDSPAKWVDIFTGLVYSPDKYVNMYRDLSQYPVLAKEGSIIPLDKAEVPENGCGNPSGFEILVVIGRDAKFDILEEQTDDQDQPDDASMANNAGVMRTIPVQWTQEISSLTIGPSTGPSPHTASSKRSFSVRFLNVTGLSQSSITATFEGKQLSNTAISVQMPKAQVTTRKSESLFSGPATTISLPSTSFPLSSPITISLASGKTSKTPVTLDDVDALPRIFKFIHASQLNFDLKSQLWSVVSDPKISTAGKLARLSTIDVGISKIISTSTGDIGDGAHGQPIDKNDVLGPIIEVLAGVD